MATSSKRPTLNLKLSMSSQDNDPQRVNLKPLCLIAKRFRAEDQCQLQCSEDLSPGTKAEKRAKTDCITSFKQMLDTMTKVFHIFAALADNPLVSEVSLEKDTVPETNYVTIDKLNSYITIASEQLKIVEIAAHCLAPVLPVYVRAKKDLVFRLQGIGSNFVALSHTLEHLSKNTYVQERDYDDCGRDNLDALVRCLSQNLSIIDSVLSNREQSITSDGASRNDSC
nr:TPA_asm: hypothetical protein [Vittapili virus]